VNVGTATGNVDFATLSINLNVTMNVEVAVIVWLQNAGTVTIFRDGATVTSQAVGNNTWAAIATLDPNVASGTHTYTMQTTVSGKAICALVFVNQLMGNGSVVVNNGAVGAVACSSLNAATATASLTLNHQANVAVFYYYVAGGGVSYTIKRDGTQIAGANVSAGTALISLIDQNQGVGAHTYVASINGTGFVGVQSALIIISNGG
jgi:hypothetical protein